MKTIELVRQHASIRSLIRRAGHDPTTRDLEMQAHWARYLCVLTAGFVEGVVRNVYGEFVTKNSYSVQVIRYTKKQLDGVQNPKSDKLAAIAGTFDQAWSRDLDAFLKDDYRGDAINSIMSHRHLIAHGRSSNITIGQVTLYLGKIVDVASFIEHQCGL